MNSQDLKFYRRRVYSIPAFTEGDLEGDLAPLIVLARQSPRTQQPIYFHHLQAQAGCADGFLDSRSRRTGTHEGM